MRRSVLVKVKGNTESGAQTGDEVTVNAVGIYHEREGVHYISYEDRPSGEMPVKNLIKADQNTLSYKRTGAVRADMIFKTGEIHGFLYHTPYGAFGMETKTLYYSIDEAEDGLRLEAGYELILDGQSSGIRRLLVEVTPMAVNMEL